MSIYDLAIIGKGFTGLAAIKKAIEQKLQFCVVAKDKGMSEHFSGAFDVIDPRWKDPKLEPKDYPSIQEALHDFIKAHPEHVYARFIKNETNFLKEMADFFSFYDIPVIGDFNNMVAVFGSMGRPKPTACALKSHGVTLEEIRQASEVLLIDFPYLTEYSSKNIAKVLQQVFPAVRIESYNQWQPHTISPLASYLKFFNESSNLALLHSFIKNKREKASLVFLPPILGLENHFENLQSVMHDEDWRVVELLSHLPSASGLRLQSCFDHFFDRVDVPMVQGEVVDHECIGDQMTKIFVQSAQKDTKVIQAHVFLRATGSHDKWMKKNIAFKNLKKCGHVFTNVDTAKEKCGFGVSLASILPVFES